MIAALSPRWSGGNPERELTAPMPNLPRLLLLTGIALAFVAIASGCQSTSLARHQSPQPSTVFTASEVPSGSKHVQKASGSASAATVPAVTTADSKKSRAASKEILPRIALPRTDVPENSDTDRQSSDHDQAIALD